MTATENLNPLPCNNPVAKSPNFPVSNTERSTVKEETSLGEKYFQILLVGGEEVKKHKLMRKWNKFCLVAYFP